MLTHTTSMSSSPQPPPPPATAPAATTIHALNDDVLCEIFLRLPSVTSLARAAFSCHAFLRAVRSSPGFRRRFRELHAPPLVAFFLIPYMHTFVPAAAGTRSSDPDIAAAFADLLKDNGSEWRAEPETDSDVPYHDGYVCFVNRTTDQVVCYSPHSQALQIFPKKPHDVVDSCLEFYTLCSDGVEQLPYRVVCVHHQLSWAWARVAVFSSHTMEWQIFPETGTLLLEGDRFTVGKVVSGFVCWVHEKECILALSTTTFQLSRMDLPPPLKLPFSEFMIGQTKDEQFCIVHVHECRLSVWLCRIDNGVGMLVLHKMLPLHTIIKEMTDRSDVNSVEVELMAVVNGFVYLSVAYHEPFWGLQTPDLLSPQWFLSFCLETAEVNLLLKKGRRVYCSVEAYIMTSWPSTLIHSKDSETRATRSISEDGCPTGANETSHVLFTALHSFKEALVDSENVNFVDIDAFLLDEEKNTLMNRIITLESVLATARDRVLRISVESKNSKGMETGSWWQMCKVRLGKAWSLLFTS